MKFEIEKYRISIYGNKKAKILVLMHEDHEDGDEVWNLLSEGAGNMIAFACISGVSWEHDLTPWPAPAPFRKAEPFAGKADEYLQKLTGTILPEIQSKTKTEYEDIYIAGYSLAGLFAVYAAIRTNCFHGFVSASGSLWYPDFPAYMEAHPVPEKVRAAYFSIGEKESATKNRMMQPVEDNTRKIERILAAKGVRTRFERNPGGHFQDAGKRLAKGIEWITGIGIPYTGTEIQSMI